MHPATPNPTPLQPCGTSFPSVIGNQPVVAASLTKDDAGVGQVRLSDEQREAAITRAGLAVERHMSLRYDAQRGEDAAEAVRQLAMAQEAERLQRALIVGRSAEQIARMEEQRGLT